VGWDCEEAEDCVTTVTAHKKNNMSGAYYNEFDPYAAQWLRNLITRGLIAPGEVDERSIEEVKPEDLRGFTQCHFLPGLESGLTHLDKLGGRTTEPSGQAVARANLSASQAKELGLMTSGTFGQPCFTSSRSADLTFSLENRLKQQLRNLGSTLYKLTWRELVTPQGRYVPLLRASALRTSGRESTGAESSTTFGATSVVTDLGVMSTSKESDSMVVPTVVEKGWVTPTTRDWKDTPGMAVTAGKRIRLDQLPRQAAQWAGFGKRQTGCRSSKELSDLLNPALSRWLLGLPPTWDDAAPTAMP